MTNAAIRFIQSIYYYPKWFIILLGGLIKKTYHHSIKRSTPPSQTLKQAWTIASIRTVYGVDMPVWAVRSVLNFFTWVSAHEGKNEKKNWCREIVKENWKGFWIQEPISHMGDKLNMDVDVVMFFVHGGGMVSGDALMYFSSFITWTKSLREKYNVKLGILSVEYGLAPEYPYPIAKNQVVEAYKWLIDEANIQPSRVVFTGDSAGGNLVASSILTLRDTKTHILPGAAILVSPWLQMKVFDREYPNDYLSAEGGARNINYYLQGKERADHPYCSPLLAESLSSFPRTLMFLGSEESLYDQGRKFEAKARKDGVSVTVEIGEGYPHDYALIKEVCGKDAIKKARETIVDFVATLSS